MPRHVCIPLLWGRYVSDVDTDIARRSIRAIGDIAMSPKLQERPDMVEAIVDTLRDFLKLEVPGSVQEEALRG